MRRKQVLSQCVFCLFLAWCAQVPCRGVMLHVLAWLLHPLGSTGSAMCYRSIPLGSLGSVRAVAP